MIICVCPTGECIRGVHQGITACLTRECQQASPGLNGLNPNAHAMAATAVFGLYMEYKIPA